MGQQNKTKIVWLSFDQIETADLYAILKLRQDIFIVETGIPCCDIDNLDMYAMHLLIFIDNQLVGYLRLFLKDLFKTGYISFGRLVVKKSYRKLGISHLLMKELFRYIDLKKINPNIEIRSLVHLKNFYSQYGFKVTSNPFTDTDGYTYVNMIHYKHDPNSLKSTQILSAP